MSISGGISSRGGHHFDFTYSFWGSLSIGLSAKNTFQWVSLLKLYCDFSNWAALEVCGLVGMNLFERPSIFMPPKKQICFWWDHEMPGNTETTVPNRKTTACVKHDYVSEDKLSTEQEVRLHSSRISVQKDKCGHRLNRFDYTEYSGQRFWRGTP